MSGPLHLICCQTEWRSIYSAAKFLPIGNAMQLITVKFSGDKLLLNNPQSVDPFNRFSKQMKEITGKRKKTDEDLQKLRKLEIESKIYWDESLGVYVPASWVIALIGGVAYKQAKIAKKDIRGAVFPTMNKLKLNYDGEKAVKKIVDVVGNENLNIVQNLKQGQVRVAKATPIFSDWSFEVSIEFEPEIINESDLKQLIEYGAKYGGFGDFRPTFGRAKVEFID